MAYSGVLPRRLWQSHRACPSPPRRRKGGGRSDGLNKTLKLVSGPRFASSVDMTLIILAHPRKIDNLLHSDLVQHFLCAYAGTLEDCR